MAQKQLFQRCSDDYGSLVIATLMAGFVFVSCYLRFFVFPNVPILPQGDQLLFVSNADRLAHGELPYRDFFAFLPSGTYLAYAVAIKVAGLSIQIPALMMSFLAATTALFVTLASQKVLCGFTAILPTLLFAGFILLVSNDATHHWFSTVLVLVAMLLLFEEHTLLRIAVVGVFCGAAACFTQTKGVLAVLGFVAYFLWKPDCENSPKRRLWINCLLLCGAAFVVVAVVNAYFIWAAGFSRWFYCLFVFPLRYFSVPALNNWRVVKYDFQWHRSLASFIAFPFVYCVVPLVYVIFLLVRRYAKKAEVLIDHRLVLVAITGIAMFLAIAPSPSVKRLGTVSPPALIILAWLLGANGSFTRIVRNSLAIIALVVAVGFTIRAQTRRYLYLDLPAGRTAFSDVRAFEEYSWIQTHTQQGQFFWGMPPFYLPFHLCNPAAIQEHDTSDYTRPEQVAALVNSLQEHDVPLMILPSEDKYPLTRSSTSNHMEPFVVYLKSKYHRTLIFVSGDEVWEQNEHASNVGP